MSSSKFVFHMDGVSKAIPGGKKLFENIRLSFLPGVKIGGGNKWYRKIHALKNYGRFR